ncbi:MAG TPA: hypothetical protein VFO06_08225, partial [Gemmatimonadales bacterium]|nr:hypothetical protein [Gemmatimonadales bacterium]
TVRCEWGGDRRQDAGPILPLHQVAPLVLPDVGFRFGSMATDVGKAGMQIVSGLVPQRAARIAPAPPDSVLLDQRA